MCGRYNLRSTPKEMKEFFDLAHEPAAFSVRYNITPTQTVPALRLVDDKREAAFRRHRCLIPAIGFYEWKAGTGKVAQTFRIHPADNQLLGKATEALRWSGPDRRADIAADK